jgi:hypothetical protein
MPFEEPVAGPDFRPWRHAQLAELPLDGQRATSGRLGGHEPLPYRADQPFHFRWSFGREPTGSTRTVLGPSRIGGVIPLAPLIEPIPTMAQGPANRTGGFTLEIATHGLDPVLRGVGHGLSLRFWRAE